MNSESEIKKRVKELLNKMNIEEKVAQTRSLRDIDSLRNKDFTVKKSSFDEKCKEGMGALQLPLRNKEIEERVKFLNNIQKHFIENTRLGIPVMIHEECLHGHLAKDATSFPVPIAMASTWDTDLIEKSYAAIALEARARGGHEAHTPVLDLARDPRWGRTEETYGEDTYLASRMGVAAVRGLQGNEKEIDDQHIISAPKHFAGYGQSTGGRNFAPTIVTDRMLEDEIFPPFKAAVQEAGALGIMPSHSEIDGIPCHGNKKLLTDILRKEWGFKGIVVSDYDDVERLDILHHVVGTQKEAAAKALQAGVDMDLPNGNCYINLINAVKEDKQLEDYLDKTVSRILRLKFNLGLFDNPYIDLEQAKKVINCSRHKKLTKKVADKAITLLKNKDSLLPLDINSIDNIAVVGPNAHPISTGTYSVKPNKGISIRDGIINKVKDKMNVIYAEGCRITKGKDEMATELDTGGNMNPETYTLEEDISLIEEAVDKVKKSDVAVVCIGGNTLTSREAVFFNGHRGDRAELDLVGQQQELLARLIETGTPVVAVLLNGKPLTVNYLAENVSSILECWYLGEETGNTVADTLFGDNNPGGKLPITFPRSVGHLPVYYSQKSTGFFKKYLFEDNSPLFPFAYGLSYTTFKYSNLKVPASKKVGEAAEIEVEVTNTGELTGDEVVQMYVRDKVSSVTRPVMELKGFKRISLNPGQTKKVSFLLRDKELIFTNQEMEKVVEAGEFEILIGGSSIDLESRILSLKA